MSSYNPSVSQPQLLTPQFFEQPPKLLPPSVFRQAIESDGHQPDQENGSYPKSTVSKCIALSPAPSPKLSGRPRAADDNHADPIKAQPNDSSGGGSVQNAPTHSVSKKCSDEFINPKCDNQLLLVAENVSYSLAAKQRWKKSEHLAAGSSKGDEVDKVTKVPTTPTKGQLPQDTPTLLTSGKTTRTTPVPETALSRSSDSLTVFSVNDSPATHSVVSFPISTFVKGCDLPLDDKPLISAPQSPAVPDSDYSCRNDFDKVKCSASKPHITDNLKLSLVDAPPTELNTSSEKIKSHSRSSKSHSELVSPTHPKSKVPCDFVDIGKSTSPVSVRSVETMASAVVDTENDCMVAQLLQNEEYSCTSRVPGEYVVEQEVKRKPKKQTMDCSSDYEIARRLQQELDAEMAHCMQREDHHERPRSGQGRRLGTRSDDGDTVHESVGGYYDNNNQYCYAIREHVAERPGFSVGHGSVARGSSSWTRRPLPSRHRYHSGATATTAAVMGEDMDMSYEALVQLEDVSRGLDKDTISRLSNTYKYHPSSSTDKSCSVCLCEFEIGELLRSLPCIHAFHKNCIDKWLTNNRHCPVCMKDIDLMHS